jgi:hypothetical protein
MWRETLQNRIKQVGWGLTKCDDVRYFAGVCGSTGVEKVSKALSKHYESTPRAHSREGLKHATPCYSGFILL